jgi:hypothetical protein
MHIVLFSQIFYILQSINVTLDGSTKCFGTNSDTMWSITQDRSLKTCKNYIALILQLQGHFLQYEFVLPGSWMKKL